MNDVDYLEDFHDVGDINCGACKETDKSYPRVCSCGGLIHAYTYWYDEFDSAERSICDKCKKVDKARWLY